MQALTDEASDTISCYCLNSQNNLNISSAKLGPVCEKNSNTNFVGEESSEIYFRKQSQKLTEKKRVGCPDWYCIIQSSASNTLAINCEEIANKVRTERLAICYEFRDNSYLTVLTLSGTRWLSLMLRIPWEWD